MGKILYEYLMDSEALQGIEARGPWRTITKQGRSGMNATSIKTLFAIPAHNLNAPKGSLDMWFMSLEDLATAAHIEPYFSINNKNYSDYTLLSDHPSVRNFRDSVFSLNWSSRWYPQLYAKFYRGNIYDDAYRPRQRLFVGAGHLNLHKNNWYHVSFTWDKEAMDHNIYVNGVLVAASDRYPNEMIWETCGETLYTGNPTLAVSDIRFYEDVLSAAEVRETYLKQAAHIPAEINEELNRMFCGSHVADFRWEPDGQWKEELSLSLTEEQDLQRFYVQGCVGAPRITKEGLLVHTPHYLEGNSPKTVIDTNQVYLWSDRTFEGDLYIEYEFMPLERGGLSLLMVHASGMQREDFMADYPLRINGSMSMVCWEDVRNYHWEYYREVRDTRNDVASHAMIKNPWLTPMGYRCMEDALELNKWHKLQYLQQGDQITCVLNSQVIFNLKDNPFSNNGPVYNFGRMAIRCMINTKMLFRNLKVMNKMD